MSNLRVLVVGAGIAGPVVAYWLGKCNAQVTVIERSPGLFKSGQGIDIEGPALEIVRRMGVEQTIRSRTTGEKGLSFVDGDNKPLATFDGGGFTSDIEIMRGDLAEILIRAAETMDNVCINYGYSVKSLRQTNDKVFATFQDSREVEFDVVIAADGLRSKTRDLILDPVDRESCVKPRDQFIAYFSIPREPQDAPRSRWQNDVDGRSLLIRPHNEEISSAYLNATGKYKRLEEALHQHKQVQKEAFAEIFADVSGNAPRVIRQMKDADDFYFEQIAQVKLARWSRGRCAIVGDAGYCPSPITGMGTNLAIVGAFVLAGEIAQSGNDLSVAFRGYETTLRPYVEKGQSIALGGKAPDLINPQTGWGVWLLRLLLEIVSLSRIWKLFGSPKPEEFALPDYAFGRGPEAA